MNVNFQSVGGGALSSSRSHTGRRNAPIGASSPVLTLEPLPMRNGSLTVAELINLYMAHYVGRDPSRIHRLGWWAGRLGDLRIQDVSDDDVHASLESLSEQTATFYAGLDAYGKAIHRAKVRTLWCGTLCRHCAWITLL